MNREFIKAIEELEKEKEISKDVLIEAIESALVSAYKKNYGTSQNVRVNINKDTGDIDVFMKKDVVEEVWEDLIEISLEDALEIDPRYKIGDAIEYQVTPKDFGRIAAQTAKQVVVQRIREAERGMIFDDYINRQGEIINGQIHRISNDTLFINMGKTEGILAATEQVPGERYDVNDRIKVYIMDVKKTTKGPQVYLSRSHPGLVKRLFELEVPEIEDGVIEIKSISREAGSRTKMAVYALDENVDAVGACVGPRGSRVQVIVDELFGEKIDIINWSDYPEELISSALSPAKVEQVLINDEDKTAIAVVPDYQLSLAIGKEGQNVRLAAKLCGWKIDIKSHTQYYSEPEEIVDYEEDDLEMDSFESEEELLTGDLENEEILPSDEVEQEEE
ncbi:transcription termination/antitermination protein NusA [Aminipila butyrica]|uniref:Transcription termination/antitermination protein NusA n=1 Tax=Aminipila butyrica TaxID=433296 RepID=A0A858BST5_9FIRM|nr:transcription termination factor NusA [Aminipila butyrica]QIB69041.1 transcription termination/antitermination protein NusA [Aminipila butyrica]